MRVMSVKQFYMSRQVDDFIGKEYIRDIIKRMIMVSGCYLILFQRNVSGGEMKQER